MGYEYVYLIIFVIGLFVAFAMQPKPIQPPPPSLDDMQIPTAEPGRPIPVIFGTRLVKAPNVVWYGDLKYSAVRTSSGK